MFVQFPENRISFTESDGFSSMIVVEEKRIVALWNIVINKSVPILHVRWFKYEGSKRAFIADKLKYVEDELELVE